MRASGRSERAAARLRRKRTRAAPASGRLQIEKDGDQERQQAQKRRRSEADEQAALLAVGRRRIAQRAFQEIGRAHVWTPVTNAQLVCRLLLEKKIRTALLEMRNRWWSIHTKKKRK